MPQYDTPTPEKNPTPSGLNKEQEQLKPANATEAIQDFLDRFAHALTAGDAHEVAFMWGTPAYVIGEDMVQVIKASKDVEIFFSGAKDQYASMGVFDTRAEIQRLEWASENIAIVKVRWPYLDKSGKETGFESSTYTLKRDGENGEFKIYIAVMHGMQAKH